MNQQYQPFQPLLTQAGLQRFGLSLQFLPADKMLSGIVHSYLQISTDKATPYPVIPDGTQAIFISPHSSIIGGAQSRACDLQISQAGEYFGIRFYPGALRYFFDLNLAEITDQFVDEKYFLCRHFSQLHHNIYQLQDFHQRAQVCEKWLLRTLKPKSTTVFDHALSLIYQSFGTIKVNQLAAETACGSRHLNRLFRAYTGLSTKTFSQTIRMQRACKQLSLNSMSSLSSLNSLNIANNLNYFDQAHFLKDFNKRLLANPGTFFDRFKSDFYNS